MKLHLFESEQWINRSLEHVFPFFEKPENLARITPPSLGFKILTPGPIEMRQGALIDYTVKVMGIQTRWTTLITDYDPPRRFVDVQLRGPYSFWHHTHFFDEIDGATRMKDEVRYGMPFGPLGEVVRMLHVERQIQNIFDYRLKVIEKEFS